jgi:hypothetical protein
MTGYYHRYHQRDRFSERMSRLSGLGWSEVLAVGTLVLIVAAIIASAAALVVYAA